MFDVKNGILKYVNAVLFPKIMLHGINYPINLEDCFTRAKVESLQGLVKISTLHKPAGCQFAEYDVLTFEPRAFEN